MRDDRRGQRPVSAVAERGNTLKRGNKEGNVNLLA
jgi:hypothetical protein